MLAAYEEWGIECLDRFRGMFALAMLDQRDGSVFLARDRLGIKPLYYLSDPERLAFASELKVLLVAGIAPIRVSTSSLETFLTHGAVGEPQSLIENVRMLGAGSSITWSQRRAVVRKYWSLGQAFATPATMRASEWPREALREVLEDAVAKHLVSDVPLGVFLSGGIDSSALVGLVAHVSGSAPVTLSVDFAEARFSERRYMQLVQSRFKTHHHEVRLGPGEFLAMLPGALAAMDQPTIDGLNTFVVSSAARGAGLTVALSGLGGDELFGGYETFRLGSRLGLVGRVPGPVRRVGTWTASRLLGPSDRTEKVIQLLLSDATPSSSQALYRQLFTPAQRRRLVNTVAAEPGESPFVPVGLDDFNMISYLELDSYMRNTLLRDADVFSMAHSLELRVPLLDNEVVRYVASLPGAVKSRGGPKALLIDAVHDLVPPEIANRRKMGFSLPFSEWMQDGLRSHIDEALSDPTLGGPLCNLLDAGEVRRVWDAFLQGRTNWARPWALFVLKMWGQRLADAPT
jgi:asparagine synthase (glutamine-hydrolysing)